MKRTVRVLVALVALTSLLGCGSVLQMIGKLTQGALQTTVDDVSELTVWARISHYNRPRPFLKHEIEYVRKAGFEGDSSGDGVFLIAFQGMKFAEIDGEVKVNGQVIPHFMSGTYFQMGDVKPGQPFAFSLKGKQGPEATFTQAYDGATLVVSEPAEGATLDMSQPFTLRWTPGPDPKKIVKVSVKMEQIGLENFLPVAYFPDTGEGVVTTRMLADLNLPGQSIKEGPSHLLIERQKDIVQYKMYGDTTISVIDADAIPVTIQGSLPEPERPFVAKHDHESGDLTVAFGDSYLSTNVLRAKDLKRFGFSTFRIEGTTGGSESSTSSVTAGNIKTTTTTTTTWQADLGEDNLKKLVNAMAERLSAAVTGTLGVAEVPASELLATPAYQRMNHVPSESNPMNFYVNARGLTDLTGWHQFVIKAGGHGAWYFDMQQATDSQLLFEVTFRLDRQKPKNKNEFTFRVHAQIDSKSYPLPIQAMYSFPPVVADWTADSFEWQDGMAIADVLKALKFDDFVAGFVAGLEQWKTTQATLPY